MLAFNGDESLKQDLLREVKKHRQADMIRKGIYGHLTDNNFQGCAVGCTLRSYALLTNKVEFDVSKHINYEKFGIPIILAKLEDKIFENLPEKESLLWPEQFLNAAQTGSDLTKAWPKFAIWLMIDKKHGVINYAKTAKAKKAIKHVAYLYQNNGTKQEFKDAAADAAAYAADAAADAAYAADAAADAAYAYAADAAYAAYAYAADDAAADAAAYAAYAYAADAAADGINYLKFREEKMVIMSKKLLSIMKSCK